MEKTVLFSLVVVLCVGTGTASANEKSEVDVSVTQKERLNKALDTAVRKERLLNGSKLEVDRADDECSYSRPCLNGGSCGWYGKCACPYGIEGDFCEKIVACDSMCENRLELECLYNSNQRVAYCSCKNWSLYYDQEDGVCKPCPCGYGYCGYEYTNSQRKLVCSCNHGYQEFKGYCRECDCGSGVIGQCEFDSDGEKVCKCMDGFFEREGRCRLCSCMSDSDMNTKCEVSGNTKRCFCPEGYQDVLGHCESLNIDPCEANNTCHPSAKCYNVFGNIKCECPDGYESVTFGKEVAPGEICRDIDECLWSSGACRYSYRMECVNLPGSYKCECLPGYESETYRDEPHKTVCVTTSVNVTPAVIVFCIALGLLIVSRIMHNRVKKRAG